jgi:hypothetical protein
MKNIKRFGVLLLLTLLFVLSAQAQFTTTTNMSLKKPNSGLTVGWDTYLNGNMDALDAYLGGVNTLTANSTAPSVIGGKNWKTANTVPTAYTNFTGGFAGQEIRILCTDTDSVFLSGATISVTQPFICNGANSISFILSGTVWVQVATNGNMIYSLPGFRITRTCLADGGSLVTAVLSCTQGDKVQAIAAPTSVTNVVATATQPPLAKMTTGASTVIVGYESASAVNYFTGNNVLYQTGVLTDDWNATAGTWNERVLFGVGSTTAFSGSSDTPTAWGAFFRASSNVPDTNWQCMVANNAPATATDSGVAVGVVFHRFQIFFNDTTSHVLFYIDNVEVCDVSTGVPATGHAMRRFMSVQPISSAARNLSIAYDMVQNDQ